MELKVCSSMPCISHRALPHSNFTSLNLCELGGRGWKTSNLIGMGAVELKFMSHEAMRASFSLPQS